MKGGGGGGGGEGKVGGGGVTCKYAASGNIDNAEYFCIIYVPALSSSCREPCRQNSCTFEFAELSKLFSYSCASNRICR